MFAPSTNTGSAVKTQQRGVSTAQSRKRLSLSASPTPALEPVTARTEPAVTDPTGEPEATTTLPLASSAEPVPVTTEPAGSAVFDSIALSDDRVIAACRRRLIDTLTKNFDIPWIEAEAAADRAVKALEAAPPATPPATPHPSAGTKLGRLITLLGRPEGATLAEMISATGWQGHSVRGVLSGSLKKKHGLAISSEKTVERGRVYHLPAGG